MVIDVRLFVLGAAILWVVLSLIVINFLSLSLKNSKISKEEPLLFVNFKVYVWILSPIVWPLLLVIYSFIYRRELKTKPK